MTMISIRAYPVQLYSATFLWGAGRIPMKTLHYPELAAGTKYGSLGFTLPPTPSLGSGAVGAQKNELLFLL